MLGKSHTLSTIIIAPVTAYSLGLNLYEGAGFTFLATLMARMPDKIEIFKGLLGHRTWSHCLIPCLILTFITIISLIQTPYLFLSGLPFGYTLHIIMDGFSKRGVPFLPFFKFRVPLYRTGKKSELLFISVLFLGATLFWSHYFNLFNEF